jgi:hypothetical protein
MRPASSTIGQVRRTDGRSSARKNPGSHWIRSPMSIPDLLPKAWTRGRNSRSEKPQIPAPLTFSEGRGALSGGEGQGFLQRDKGRSRHGT